ncbi:E3 ubiquitin-protein ligase LRSAM1-like isoform X2 [Anthonomus grandis grandis]|uniref:E3 ubiquitin-protein ligase LRSAM1-like isoform X2 n=1 Tax=Anthonomus grandis grandis TaxID=2921223 RepID=UPI002165D4EA|nr:E3 ubiquitin-protein ligase LRSAM1-like isoform X2 [Anthonomus grandis grandis]
MVVPLINCDIICAMFRRKRSVNKQRLEHKLYLARETPEPIFDLSDCDLVNIPQGIYSLCKVFRKETLDLHNNQISSLSGGGELRDLCNLRVLDISHNDIHYLTEDIVFLKNLQELLVDHNHLKSLPDSLCNLTNLKILSLTDNKLKTLPENLGNLSNLQKIRLQNNPQLHRLPKSICMATKLVSIELDSEGFIYPPCEVARGGTGAIIRFISEDLGQDYCPPERIETISEDTTDTSVQAKFELKRMQDFLEIERNNELLQKQELEMASVHKANRQKLLASITDEQCKFDSKLCEIQLEKETERFRLIEQLQEVENSADLAINNLLMLNKEPTSQLLEKEREEEERLLEAVNRYNETLRKDDILAAMQDILKQETEAFNKFDRDRIETSRSILEQELDAGSKIAEILQSQDVHKANLVSQLTEDINLQKAAVGTLLERGDARSWGLLQQVRLVESQLGALTHIELDRRKLRMDEHLNDLAEKRMNLSALLMELLEQQRLRRAQLLSTIKTMEQFKCDDVDEDFWLRQYQSLLEKFPEGISHAQKNMDPKLVEILLSNGVIHCLPFLAKLTQSEAHGVTEGDLIEAGLTSMYDRQRILDALQIYSKERISFISVSPSAPPLECAGASAPPLEDPHIKAINSVECVICLDLECHVIFVPCGHLCCCTGCSVGVSLCPLCRTDIERRITMVPQ